jgi:hypothetical protein
MPSAYLLDENLRRRLWRAIQRHNASGNDLIEAVRVGDPADLPLGTPDPEILLWAEAEGCIVITLDRTTMPGHLAAHLAAGHHSLGVFVLRAGSTMSSVVAMLAYIAHNSDPVDCQDRIEYIP